MSRYVRDEILLQGLDMAHCPTVTAHDAPGGIIDPNAWCIKWLLNALDMFHRKYPFSSDITEVAMTALTNDEDIKVTSNLSLYKPSDFVLDVKDGITGIRENQFYQLKRRSYQYFRGEKYAANNRLAQTPRYYCIVNNRIKITPKVETAVALNLEYYRLDPPLAPDDEVNFPDEWSLIEFIRLRALEWTRAIEAGTAQLYLAKQLSGFRAAGLLNEPEFEEAMKLETYGMYNEGRNSWMGRTSG